jgi:hypothetical protein
MDNWSVLGVFLLGSGVGAPLTATFYSAQIRRLKQLNVGSAENSRVEQQNNQEHHDLRESA